MTEVAIRFADRVAQLILTGEMIYAMAHRAPAIRPDFAFAEMPGGGVDIVDQQPEAWAEIVAGFLGT